MADLKEITLWRKADHPLPRPPQQPSSYSDTQNSSPALSTKSASNMTEHRPTTTTIIRREKIFIWNN